MMCYYLNVQFQAQTVSSGSCQKLCRCVPAVGSTGRLRFLLESVKHCCIMTQQRSYHTQCGINYLSE